MRGLSVIATGFACAAGAAFCAGVSVQGDVFGGSSKGGAASVAHVRLDLRSLDSTCIHGTRDWVDFEPVFTPAVEGLVLSESMLQGFALNSNGTLRLSLNGSSSASGSVTVGAPPLSWGSLGAEASIHRCEGGAQEMCWACGRLHGTGDDVVCSHGRDCAACRDREADCTCSPIFVRVNWDDDDWDGDADREASAPMTDDDELVSYRALGVTRSCWCHTDWRDGSSVSGLAASSELRLWSGSVPASSGSDAFEIEAVAATEGIGTGSVRYDVCDATNGLLRTVVRSVTAANIEMRPDWDDSGDIDGSDRYWQHPDVRPSCWQVRVRETPYLLRLVSECPASAALDLDAVCTEGVAPSLRSADTGASLTTVRRNALQDVLVDTSAGAGDMELTYSLGVTGGRAELTDTLVVHVVDTSVEEKWIPAGSVSGASYDYSDVDGYVDWWVWRETDEGDEYVDGGYGPVFTLAGLEAGDYHVGVYFDDIFEDGWWGYSSFGDLHVVDVRLDRLYETANPANFIFNPTPKDDYTDKPVREEVIEDGLLRTYGAPRNNLYVVAGLNTNVLDITVQLTVTPSNCADHVMCAAYCGEVLKGECVLGTNGAARLRVAVEAGSVMESCSVRVGLDLDGDGSLSHDESDPLEVYRKDETPKYANVVGVAGERLNGEDMFISSVSEGTSGSGVGIFLPFARSLLSMFYEGDTSEIGGTYHPAITRRVSLDAQGDGVGFAEWLTHNAGAAFDQDCVASVAEYEWDSDSAFAQRLTECKPFAPWIRYVVGGGQNVQTLYETTDTGRAIISNFNAVVRGLASERLQDSPVGTVAIFSNTNGWDDTPLVDSVFRSMSPTNVTGRTVCVGSCGDYDDAVLSVAAGAVAALATDSAELKDVDAFFAIGRGRITQPSFWISAIKTWHLFGEPTYELYQVGLSCTVSDLYDFNFEDGTLPRRAATLQLGYGRSSSGRSHGQIFRHQVKINAVYTNPQAY